MLPENTTLGSLTISKVLDTYGFPRLFLCQNAAGHTYLALWMDEDDTSDHWIYAAVSKRRADEIQDGAIDLRDAFLLAEDGQVLRVKTTFDGEVVHGDVARVPVPELDPAELPPVGDRLRRPENRKTWAQAELRERPPWLRVAPRTENAVYVVIPYSSERGAADEIQNTALPSNTVEGSWEDLRLRLAPGARAAAGTC